MAEPETPLYLADWMIVIYILAATLACTLFYVSILCCRCMTSDNYGNWCNLCWCCKTCDEIERCMPCDECWCCMTSGNYGNGVAMGAPRLIRETTFSNQPTVGQLIGDLNKPNITTTTLKTGQEVPAFWKKHSNNEEVLLDLLFREKDEFRKVSEHFLKSMPRCEIRWIKRIQNKLLWRKYMDRARQMKEYDQVLGEKTLFHGTRTNKPEEIYKGDVSFDMRFCKKGMWGRGNYFAVNASYSNKYAHNEGGKHQILMAYVLTGHSCSCDPDSSLTMPPFREDQGTQDDGAVQRRYDSVCGNTNGSIVYITYENDKAYPAYLISYTVS